MIKVYEVETWLKVIQKDDWYLPLIYPFNPKMALWGCRASGLERAIGGAKGWLEIEDKRTRAELEKRGWGIKPLPPTK